ncbi:exo-alpha-sialidase [Ramlibacter aquaticus]|uniref:Exo-alpha-sialidase n=2 Tax=Ramlibacter aquaticus TaxID=2780094 RepID=A0ABR9SLS1_9BURK|nr:exo-alpha-sialidase [Ramlibacter aquaticus]
MQLAANGSYQVNAPGTAALTLTLPASPPVGSTVSVTGVSPTQWALAQNAGDTVSTLGLPGDMAPGAQWTPRLNPRVWHWLSSSVDGEVMLAGEAAGGTQDTSLDAGQTWTAGNSPSSIWINSAMSARGERLVALQYGGGIYLSTDKGVTWTRATDPLVNNPSGMAFQGTAISQDGQRIAATVQPAPGTSVPNGEIVLSQDGGTTWHAAALPAGAHWWRGIAMSSTGQVIVAVASSGEVYRSNDGGGTWTALSVTVSTTSYVESWYRVAMSADGSTLVIMANAYGGSSGSGVFVSHDGGATWTRPYVLTADYTEASVSADGRTIAVSVSNTGATPGRILLSTDGGASFQPVAMPGTDTDWRAVTVSADGDQLAAATGRFDNNTVGQLYTSLGHRSTVGTSGAITGAAGDTVVLIYQGSGRWAVQSAGGPAFAVR